MSDEEPKDTGMLSWTLDKWLKFLAALTLAVTTICSSVVGTTLSVKNHGILEDHGPKFDAVEKGVADVKQEQAAVKQDAVSIKADAKATRTAIDEIKKEVKAPK